MRPDEAATQGIFLSLEKVSQRYLQKSLRGQLHKLLLTLRELRRQKIEER